MTEGFSHFEQRINHLEIAVAALQKGVESIRDDIVAQNAAITRLGDSHTTGISKLADEIHNRNRTQWSTIISAGALILGFVLAVGNAWIQPIKIETNHNRSLIEAHQRSVERHDDLNNEKFRQHREQLEALIQTNQNLLERHEAKLDTVTATRFTNRDGQRIEDRVDQIEQRLAELKGRCEATLTERGKP